MQPLAKPEQGPDRLAALAQYRTRAGSYDLELAPFEWLRRQAIAGLALRRGDVVLDLGCGTGLSLEQLRHGVGARGRIIGVEQCPEMLAQAHQRVVRNHWRNVTLLCAPAEAAELPGSANAALFRLRKRTAARSFLNPHGGRTTYVVGLGALFTHDILRRSLALDNVVRHLEPGARVVAAGLKWAGLWAVPVNLFVWGAARYSVSSLAGLQRPWDLLAARCGRLDVENLLLGGLYIASGRLDHMA